MREYIFSILPKKVQNRIIRHFPPFLKTFEVKFPDNISIKIKNIDNSETFKYIFWKGYKGYEWGSVKLFMCLSKSSQHTFDIGGYIGYYSLLGGKVNPKTQITVFEPYLKSFEFMKQLFDFNKVHIKTENIAIGDVSGNVKFFLPNRSNSKFPNIGSLKNRFKKGEVYSDRSAQKISVRSATIDDYCKSNGITKLDLIKIDVEGFEPQVIRNGLDVISRCKPDIIAEI